VLTAIGRPCAAENAVLLLLALFTLGKCLCCLLRRIYGSLVAAALYTGARHGGSFAIARLITPRTLVEPKKGKARLLLCVSLVDLVALCDGVFPWGRSFGQNFRLASQLLWRCRACVIGFIAFCHFGARQSDQKTASGRGSKPN